jgi:hypothetical protein
MKHFDFTTEQAAQQFKIKTERLGWTTSSITYSPIYGWFVISNYPF